MAVGRWILPGQQYNDLFSLVDRCFLRKLFCSVKFWLHGLERGCLLVHTCCLQLHTFIVCEEELLTCEGWYSVGTSLVIGMGLGWMACSMMPCGEEQCFEGVCLVVLQLWVWSGSCCC